METAIWVIAILAVIFIIVIYIITSVGSYSNNFIGKVFKEEKDLKETNGNKDNEVKKTE